MTRLRPSPQRWTGILVVLAVLLPLRAAACGLGAPGALDLYLASRELSVDTHAQAMRAAVRSQLSAAAQLGELDAALGSLTARVWGLYWVSLYSRHLHLVLDDLDRPPGAMTRYYDHWDAAQRTTSAEMVLRDAGAVEDALSAVTAVEPEQVAGLRPFLERVRRELRGCTTGN